MSDQKRVQSVLDGDAVTAWATLKARLGLSDSACVEWLVREWARREAGENTKEKALARIESEQLHQRSQIGLLTTLVWAMLKQMATIATPGDGNLTIVLDRDAIMQVLDYVKLPASAMSDNG